MSYNNFIKEQTLLNEFSQKYAQDADFRAKLDKNPKCLLSDDLAESFNGEVVIRQNTDDAFYMVIPQDKNKLVDDESLNSIAAAKAEVVYDLDAGKSYYITEQGTRYLRTLEGFVNYDEAQRYTRYNKVDSHGNVIGESLRFADIKYT